MAGRHVYGVYMPAAPMNTKILTVTRSVLEQGGVEAVSMRRVARAAGITAMAIYRHYPNRQALLDALSGKGFDELASALRRRRFDGDVGAQIAKIVDTFLHYALKNPRLFELMFLAKHATARQFPRDFKAGRSPTASVAAAVVREGMERGQIRRDDPWEIVFEMGAMLQGLVMLYVGGRIDATPAQFRAQCQRAFGRYIHGIHV